ALREIEHQRRAKFFAGASQGCGVKPRSIFKAHQTGRDDARVGPEGGDVVVSTDELGLRLDDAHAQLAGAFVTQPSGKMRREFAAANQNFVAWIPVDAGGDR